MRVVLAGSTRPRPDVFNGLVGAVGYRVARWLRSNAGRSVLLVAVVALVASVPLALAAGARRTASAPERYEASQSDVLDILAYQETEGPPLTDAVAALPGVRL